ncbi:MAG: hypothetical protein PVF87_03055 [Acidimicrobiia bacterium]
MADRPQTDDTQADEISPTILAASMLLGGLVGFIIWMVTDTFVFLPVFLGAGLAFGLAIGLAWRGRNQDGDN